MITLVFWGENRLMIKPLTKILLLLFVASLIVEAIRWRVNEDRLASQSQRASPTIPTAVLKQEVRKNRERMARGIEETLLREGMDAEVRAHDDVLEIYAYTVNRPFAHQFVSDTQLMNALKLDFAEIHFVQRGGLE